VDRGDQNAELRKAIQHIVIRLFPVTSGVLDAHLGISRRRIDPRRARAISEPEYFPL
jgi:hypothetical protein